MIITLNVGKRSEDGGSEKSVPSVKSQSKSIKKPKKDELTKALQKENDELK